MRQGLNREWGSSDSPTPNSSKGLVLWCEPCMYSLGGRLHVWAVAHNVNTSFSFSIHSHFSRSVLGFYPCKSFQTFSSISRVDISKYIKWGYVYIFMLARRKWNIILIMVLFWPYGQLSFIIFFLKKSQTLTWDGEQASSLGTVEWGEPYIPQTVCWLFFTHEKLLLWALLPSGVANFTFESGLQPHSTWSIAVPWGLDCQLNAWKLTELHPTPRWLSFRKDTGLVATQRARWRRAVCGLGHRLGILLACSARRVCTGYEGRGWEHADKFSSAKPFAWGPLSFCPCLSQPIPSTAAPHQSPFLWWQLRQWGTGVWCILSRLLASCIQHTPVVPWLSATRTQQLRRESNPPVSLRLKGHKPAANPGPHLPHVCISSTGSVIQ